MISNSKIVQVESQMLKFLYLVLELFNANREFNETGFLDEIREFSISFLENLKFPRKTRKRDSIYKGKSLFIQ